VSTFTAPNAELPTLGNDMSTGRRRTETMLSSRYSDCGQRIRSSTSLITRRSMSTVPCLSQLRGTECVAIAGQSLGEAKTIRTDSTSDKH